MKYLNLILFVALLVSCGSGGGEGSPNVYTRVPLTPELRELYHRMESCTGLTAYEPALGLTKTVQCTKGTPKFCCMDGLDWATGSYGGDTIKLPDQCFVAAAHEMIHHLGEKNGVSHEHSAAIFNCQY